MRGIVSLKLYIYAFARRRGRSLGNLLIPSKRPTDLYLSLLPWLTKPSEGASGHPIRMPSCRYDDWIKNLYELRSRVHPSGNHVDHQRREVPTISTQFGLLYRIHILTPSFVNALSTPSIHASTEPPSSPFFLVHLVLLRYNDKLYHEIN